MRSPSLARRRSEGFGVVRPFLLAPALATLLWLGATTPAFACTGQDATLAAGLRHATAIYYARIQDVIGGEAGIYTVSLDVERRVKGEARTVVSGLVGAKVCTGLERGQFGLVVLDARNAFDGDGSAARYNLFYVIAPGYYRRAAVEAALRDLPATDAALPPNPSGGRDPSDLAAAIALASAFGGSFLLALRHMDRRTARRQVRT